MTDSHSTPSSDNVYLELIDQVVTMTLKGQIRSKQQVFKMLQSEIEPEEGDRFAQTLTEQMNAVAATLESETDEMKLAKATRRQRALTTLQSEF